MERAAAALDAGEGIGILGDYDVDGGCASALLLCFFRAARARSAALHSRPHERRLRPLGRRHGIAARSAARASSITVDCGAAAVAALDEAQRLGLDVIVLDHHAVETNPPALAHVNPNGPDDTSGLTYLAGTAVTFHVPGGADAAFARAGLVRSARQDASPISSACLDLVALATIADVVPLTGVNRAFVRLGLQAVARARAAGAQGACRGRRRRAAVLAATVWASCSGRASTRAAASGAAIWVRCLLATGDEAEADEFAALLEPQQPRAPDHRGRNPGRGRGAGRSAGRSTVRVRGARRLARRRRRHRRRDG